MTFKAHDWRSVLVSTGKVAHPSRIDFRCDACGMGRRKLPFIGLRRPWPPMCQG